MDYKIAAAFIYFIFEIIKAGIWIVFPIVKIKKNILLSYSHIIHFRYLF
jgi:hypothetical protein